MNRSAKVLDLEYGPTCSARTVDGFVRLGAAGVAWGLIAGSHYSLKEGFKGFSRAVYVSKYVGKSSLLWGSAAGTYFGLNCGIERLRMKRDVINASVAGAVTGALMAVKTASASKIFSSSLAISAAATVVHYISPLQYPPIPEF